MKLILLFALCIGQALAQDPAAAPANLRVADRAQKLSLKFVDPAVILGGQR
jgi:hypothetical protein